MLCKDCKLFDTAPGMKWGICDHRRKTTKDVIGLVKGPETICTTPDVFEKKEETSNDL